MNKNSLFEIDSDFLGFIPELPEVASKFIELSREIAVPKNSYASLLLTYPVLSSRVFSYLNLILNNSASNYISINKGVSIMGLHRFKNLIIAFSLFHTFEEAKCVNLFKYSIETACFCKQIAEKFNLINPDDAFLLGFLHDIGKLALKNKFEEKYRLNSLETSDIIHDYTPEEEIAQFKYCHSDISEYICKKWNMPVVVSDAIKFHHFPLSALLPAASSIIYIADMLARKSLKPTGDDQKILQYMQLSDKEIFCCIQGSKTMLEPIYSILNIV